MDSPLEAALFYFRKGWKPILLHGIKNGKCTCPLGEACASAGKHPVYDGWQKMGNSEEEIRKWYKIRPHHNVGIATGTGTGLVVLDVDTVKGGEDSLHELQEKHGRLPRTPTQITGSGGLHFLFQHPMDRSVTQGSSMLPGIDTRADGGLIVVAPSMHLSGKRYMWDIEEGPDTELAPCPQWLLELKKEEAENGERNPEGWMEEALQGVPEGQRDETCVKIIGRLVTLGMTDGEIETIMHDWNNKCHPPMGSGHREGDPIQWIRKKLRSVRKKDAGSKRITFSKTGSLYDALVQVTPPLERGEKPESIPFGIPAVDHSLGGLRKGRMYTLAARTSMGKSAAAIKFALEAAKRGKRVLYVSLEMTHDEIALRTLSAVTGIGIYFLDTGKVTEKEQKTIAVKKHMLDELSDRFNIHFQAGLTPDYLVNLTEEYNPHLLVVDHIGLLRTGHNETEYQIMTKAAQSIKSLALSADIPVLALVQLSRATEDNLKSKPSLRNLRGSGHIEENSDVVMLLYRAKYYDETLPNEMEINIAKSRQGETCNLKIPFYELIRFSTNGAGSL